MPSRWPLPKKSNSKKTGNAPRTSGPPNHRTNKNNFETLATRGLSNEAHVNTYINNQTNNIKQTMWTYINKMIKFAASHFIYDNKHNHTSTWGGAFELRQTAILTGMPVIVLTNHPQPNKLITVHWPSIETRA